MKCECKGFVSVKHNELKAFFVFTETQTIRKLNLNKFAQVFIFYSKALIPVTSIPVINKWISCVPS